MENVNYSKKEDILYINMMGEKVQESVPKGGFVIDLSSKGKVAGVEILNASEALSELLDEEPETIQEILENMEEADVVTKEVQGIAFMILNIISVKDGEREETKVNLEVPEPLEV